MVEISNKMDYEHQFHRCTIREALDIALDTRNFEIELYWKRANYFVIIIGAIFIGFYTVEGYYHGFLLSLLGYVVSFAWICLNRGSKFWQENWEKNIEYLSDINGTPIFNLVRKGERKPFLFMTSYPYYVSRLNLIVSIAIWISWFLLIALDTYKTWTNEPDTRWYLIIGTKCFVVFIVPVIVHFISKGFMARETCSCQDDKNKIVVNK